MKLVIQAFLSNLVNPASLACLTFVNTYLLKSDLKNMQTYINLE